MAPPLEGAPPLSLLFPALDMPALLLPDAPPVSRTPPLPDSAAEGVEEQPTKPTARRTREATHKSNRRFMS